MSFTDDIRSVIRSDPMIQTLRTGYKDESVPICDLDADILCCFRLLTRCNYCKIFTLKIHVKVSTFLSNYDW